MSPLTRPAVVARWFQKWRRPERGASVEREWAVVCRRVERELRKGMLEKCVEFGGAGERDGGEGMRGVRWCGWRIEEQFTRKFIYPLLQRNSASSQDNHVHHEGKGQNLRSSRGEAWSWWRRREMTSRRVSRFIISTAASSWSPCTPCTPCGGVVWSSFSLPLEVTRREDDFIAGESNLESRPLI